MLSSRIEQDIREGERGTGFKAWLKLNSIPRGTSRMWMTHRCRHTGAAAMGEVRPAGLGGGHKKWQQQQQHSWQLWQQQQQQQTI